MPTYTIIRLTDTFPIDWLCPYWPVRIQHYRLKKHIKADIIICLN